MAAVTIRNLSDATHRALKARAAQNHRSAEDEIRAILDAAVLRWTPSSVQFGGLAKVGSGSFYAASWSSGLALSGASPG